MLKKVLFISILFLNFLALSCNNILESDYGRNNLTFSIGKTAKNISSEIKANESINDDTLLNVECNLIKDEKSVNTQSVSVALKDLGKTSFELDNILFGDNYHIFLTISYNNIPIYEAVSDAIDLNESNKNVKVNLILEKKYSEVKYDLDGGVFRESPVVHSYFINSNIELPVPKKLNYKFDGWYLTKDYEPENKVLSLGKDCFLGNVVLYAKWINLGGVASVSFTPSQTPDENNAVDYKQTVALSCETDGATIWYTTDDTDPKISDSRTEYSGTAIVIENDVTIRAYAEKPGQTSSGETSQNYKVKTYSVTFHTDRGISPNDITGQKKGDIVTKPADLTENGWTFDGWYNNDVKVTGNITITGNLVLTAKWIEWPTVSDVTFSKTGAVDYKEKVTLSCATEGAEIHYAVGNGEYQTLSSPYEITITQNSTIKAYATKASMNNSHETSANYTIKTYSVTFNTDHGTAPNKIENLKRGDKVLASNFNTLTVEGYTFENWKDENGKVITNSADYEVIGNMTFTANWKINQYTITYETNCDKTIAPKTVDYNYALTSSDLTSSGLTKNDCTFAGWYVEDKIIKIGDKVTKNIKLIAKWDFGTVAVNQTITKDGSTSINATPYDYVLFGEWPQTLKSTSVTIDESMTGTYNGWTCYKGNDNAYYVKIKANPKDDTNSTNRNNELFNDGVTRIIHDEYYYFKIEPIRWRVLTTNYNNTGNKLLLAEKVLARNPLTSNEAYNKGSRKILVDSTFKHDIYHNGCFFDRAFSTESKNKIAFTEIKADNTIYNDKLFLLDKTEMGDTAFGFQSDIYNTSDSYRQRQPTDFAKATGVYIDNPDGTWWWLRSKDSIGPSGREVQYGLGSSDGGMVPALCLPNSLVF